METMWAPWRSEYINGGADSNKAHNDVCTFCHIQTIQNDEEANIIYRGELVFVVLNLYPYNNGHMLVIPNRHISRPDQMTQDERHTVMDYVIKAESILFDIYHPHGVNIGANVGKAAGAGIAEHMHFHVLPRWEADSNFMTTIANTRVIPEALNVTWKKIRDAWN